MPRKAARRAGPVEIHNANQGVLWARDWRQAPLCGDATVISAREGVQRGAFIANQRTVRVALAIWLVAGLPVGSVCAKKRQPNALVACVFDAIAHLFRPVFVVAERDISQMV